MSKRVLVAYGTKHGSTAEIAEKIGEVLTQTGLSVDVKNAKEVKDVSGYDAVVIGSGVYMGMWRKEAVRMFKKQAVAMAGKKVWCFSSGPTDEGDDPVQLVQGWTFPKGLKPVAEQVGVLDYAVFHGRADPAHMTGFDKWIMEKVGAPTGDYRNWEMITTWAASIAAELTMAGA